MRPFTIEGKFGLGDYSGRGGEVDESMYSESYELNFKICKALSGSNFHCL